MSMKHPSYSQDISQAEFRDFFYEWVLQSQKVLMSQWPQQSCEP
uniref:Uncharacterized protein n=1 Tax=Anguilla anguilla TaxID=7936 RepID=A0A0E9PPP2_ANGAN